MAKATNEKADKKKTVAKAEKKPAAPPREAGPKYGDEGNTGIDRTFDVPWNEKKVAIFRAMKALRCFDASSAKSGAEVAEKANTFYKGEGDVKAKNVLHYVYHARSPVSKLTDCGKVEGIAGYAVWLTKKGQAIDPVAELKKQEAAKES